MVQETPQIQTVTYTTSNTGSGLDADALWENTGGSITAHKFGGVIGDPNELIRRVRLGEYSPEVVFPAEHWPSQQEPQTQPSDEEEEEEDTMPKRLVKVIIADPHKDVPVEDSLLYSGDELFTDLTDQELYFELNIKELLTMHNAKRVTFKKEGSKDSDEKLKPARIRDLVMTVVQIAQFGK